jgi:hypothetical protein
MRAGCFGWALRSAAVGVSDESALRSSRVASPVHGPFTPALQTPRAPHRRWPWSARDERRLRRLSVALAGLLGSVVLWALGLWMARTTP